MAFDLKNIDFKNIDFKDAKTQKYILFGVLGTLLFVVYIYFIFLPQLTKDVVVTGKALTLSKDLKEGKNLIGQTDTFKKKVDEYKDKIELYEQKLPAQQEIPSLLENLSKMARNANISIIGITPVVLKSQKEKKGLVYKEIPILITAKSGYHELGRFLSHLESGDRFMKVVDISIKANSTTPKKHDVELMVYTYVLPNE